jgi:hypothetical protein
MASDATHTLRNATLQFALAHCVRDLSLLQWLVSLFDAAPSCWPSLSAGDRALLARGCGTLAELLPPARLQQLVQFIFDGAGPADISVVLALLVGLRATLTSGSPVVKASVTSLLVAVVAPRCLSLLPVSVWSHSRVLQQEAVALAAAAFDALVSCLACLDNPHAACSLSVSDESGLDSSAASPLSLHADALMALARCSLVSQSRISVVDNAECRFVVAVYASPLDCPGCSHRCAVPVRVCRTWVLRPGSIASTTAISSAAPASWKQELCLSVLVGLGRTAAAVSGSQRLLWCTRLLEFASMLAASGKGAVRLSTASNALIVLAVTLLSWHGSARLSDMRTGCSIARGGPSWAQDVSPQPALFWRDALPCAALLVCGPSPFEAAASLLRSLSFTTPVAVAAGDVDDAVVSQLLHVFRTLRSLRTEQLSPLDALTCQHVLPPLLASLTSDTVPIETFLC